MPPTRRQRSAALVALVCAYASLPGGTLGALYLLAIGVYVAWEGLVGSSPVTETLVGLLLLVVVVLVYTAGLWVLRWLRAVRRKNDAGPRGAWWLAASFNLLCAGPWWYGLAVSLDGRFSDLLWCLGLALLPTVSLIALIAGATAAVEQSAPTPLPS